MRLLGAVKSAISTQEDPGSNYSAAKMTDSPLSTGAGTRSDLKVGTSEWKKLQAQIQSIR